MEPEINEEEYFIPLQDQRVFGAGISKKKITFVAESPSTSILPLKPATKSAASDIYLSIVLGKKDTTRSEDATTTLKPTPPPPTLNQAPRLGQEAHTEQPAICPICNLAISSTSDGPGGPAISRPHEAGLVHQICLQHSHPPSSIDRSRPGLKYLESYGWDPDSRRGLGPQGEGRRDPIKGKVKMDTVGLGVKLKRRSEKMKEVARVEKLDAKKVRRMEAEGRRKGERLREMFYRGEDVERYLGGG